MTLKTQICTYHLKFDIFDRSSELTVQYSFNRHDCDYSTVADAIIRIWKRFHATKSRPGSLKHRLIPTNPSCTEASVNMDEETERESTKPVRWTEIAWNRMEWVPTRQRNNLIYRRTHDYPPQPLLSPCLRSPLFPLSGVINCGSIADG